MNQSREQRRRQSCRWWARDAGSVVQGANSAPLESLSTKWV